jgi:hypothetical protein
MLLARELPNIIKRPVIAIVTAQITEDSIFQNGLYQNAYFIYKLIEAIGCIPILIINEKTDKYPEFMQQFNCITVDDLVRNPIPLTVYLEVGLSTAPHIRKFMRTCGARIARIYLGNIFNIDVETPLFYGPMNFSHHVIGETDMILTSPHYSHYSEYMASLDNINVSSVHIAPYVWGPDFITKHNTDIPLWIPPTDTVPTFIIMEPNISFQKNAILPLLALEKWVTDNFITNARIILINGKRLEISTYYKQLIASLTIHKNAFIDSRDRMNVRDVMKEFPSATIICYHKDNELNYMALEFLYTGYPVIHNAKTWEKAGYYYTADSIDGCAAALQAVRQHADRQTVYRSQTQQIFWQHSIHNPTVQETWYKFLMNP